MRYAVSYQEGQPLEVYQIDEGLSLNNVISIQPSEHKQYPLEVLLNSLISVHTLLNSQTQNEVYECLPNSTLEDLMTRMPPHINYLVDYDPDQEKIIQIYEKPLESTIIEGNFVERANRIHVPPISRNPFKDEIYLQLATIAFITSLGILASAWVYDKESRLLPQEQHFTFLQPLLEQVWDLSKPLVPSLLFIGIVFGFHIYKHHFNSHLG